MALGVGHEVEVARGGGLHGIVEDVRPGQVLVCFDSGERSWVPDSQVKRKVFSLRPGAPTSSSPPGKSSTPPRKASSIPPRSRGTVNPYAAPRKSGRPRYDNVRPTSMSYKELLFSFDGRIGRLQYWMGSLVAILPLLAIVAWGMLAGASSSAPGTTEQAPQVEGGSLLVSLVGLLALVVYGVILWMSFAVSVKRWHDHDKSGWWVLLALIPVLGALASFIILGCMRGTDGPNRFGPDPLGS